MKALEPWRVGLQLQQVLPQLQEQLSQAGQQVEADRKVVKKLLEQLQQKVQQMLQLWLLLPPLQPSFLPAEAVNFDICWQIKSDDFIPSTVCTAKWKIPPHCKYANSP